MKAILGIMAAVCTIYPGLSASAEDGKPTIRVELEEKGDQVVTMVRIAVPTIPDFQCDVWCYEGPLGQGEVELLPDGGTVLTHKHPQGATVETKLAPSVGAVDWDVTVTGPTPEAVKAVRSVNGCWQFRRTVGFQSLEDQFVNSFVHQCFIYTADGFTQLKDTQRFPDTRLPATHKYNSPPWVQWYIPDWHEHPGQPKAFWGNSTDRPVYSIVGEVSRDRKYLAAWGCKRCNVIGQGWHDCLHIGADLLLDYDEETNRTVSHLKMYFMEFDPEKLLKQYKRDFAIP